MSWEILTANLGVKTSVYECESGFFEYFYDGIDKDCVWKNYQPINYIYTANYYSNFDGTNEIIPWTCLQQDESQIQIVDGIDPTSTNNTSTDNSSNGIRPTDPSSVDSTVMSLI